MKTPDASIERRFGQFYQDTIRIVPFAADGSHIDKRAALVLLKEREYQRELDKHKEGLDS